MNQLLGVWDVLDTRKRVIAVLSAVAMFAAVWGLARLANAPNYALLYSGLDNATSGQVVTALEGTGVPFEVRGNSIYVDSGQRDQVRMALAADGLPANGVAGYELLDNLTGFGTTAQMFDAAYWRAKEGELARTILASQNVSAARVHISNPVNKPFARKSNASASVIVTMASGTLGPAQAKAMRFLVSSAVAGLTPDEVSVIDSVEGIVLAAGSEAEITTPGDQISDKEKAMRENIERLLAARVGPGNAIVELNIDASMDSETITERILDPEGRVAISSDNEQTSSSSSGTGAGGVTVASNLPDGDVEGSDGSSNSNNNKTRERVNYEVSEVLRERVVRPGEIRRISVAVLVNGIAAEDPEQGIVPRGEDEMEALKELVKTAIGFDTARGDTVTLESMAFTVPVVEGTAAQAGTFDAIAVNGMRIFQLVFVGLVALILGLFVLRPIFTAPPPRLIDNSGGVDDPARAGLTGEVGADNAPGGNGEIEINPEVLANQDRPVEAKTPVEQLKGAITDRSDESRVLLQDWLNADAPVKEEA